MGIILLFGDDSNFMRVLMLRVVTLRVMMFCIRFKGNDYATGITFTVVLYLTQLDFLKKELLLMQNVMGKSLFQGNISHTVCIINISISITLTLSHILTSDIYYTYIHRLLNKKTTSLSSIIVKYVI